MKTNVSVYALAAYYLLLCALPRVIGIFTLRKKSDGTSDYLQAWSRTEKTTEGAEVKSEVPDDNLGLYKKCTALQEKSVADLPLFAAVVILATILNTSADRLPYLQYIIWVSFGLRVMHALLFVSADTKTMGLSRSAVRAISLVLLLSVLGDCALRVQDRLFVSF